MECVILAGGKGERMRPYTENMPKPMFQIGGKPVLWHIMRYFSHYGVDRFIVCLGYKADKITEYFRDMDEGWTTHFVDTGEESTKGERLRRVREQIKGDDFFLAYGDDLSDVDLEALKKFHLSKGKTVTLTAVPLVSNFGVIDLDMENLVKGFREKPKLDHWINGGFFCVNKKIFDFLRPGLDLEKDVLPLLAKKGEIAAYKHDGFWNAMNTHKDSQELLAMWEKGDTPWVKWES